MLSALLRSGDVKNYTALGQDGTPVYAVAPQLREAIKFRVKDPNDKQIGKKFANYLAIPQRNDQGSQIDWYVPFESERADGKYMIVPWSSATEEERVQAFEELAQFERSMLQFGLSLKNNENLQGDLLQFSRLLCGNNNPTDINDPDNLKALRFPSPEYVYLVNNRPVITFWGFVEKNANIYGHPFLSLKPAAPVAQAPVPPVVEPAPVVEEKKKPWWRWLLWLLPLLLLGLAALFFLRGCGAPTVELNAPKVDLPKVEAQMPSLDKVEERCVAGNWYRLSNGKWFYLNGAEVTDSALLALIEKSHESAEKCDRTLLKTQVLSEVVGSGNGEIVGTGANLDNGKLDTSAPNPPAAEDGKTDLQKTDENRPLVEDNKGQDPAAQPEMAKDLLADNEQDLNKANQPAQDPAKAADLSAGNDSAADKQLQIPTDNSGSLAFLNGKWNAGSGIQDKTTGKPLRLKYEFEKGKGQVRVERGDGVQCVGDVNASMNGKLLTIGNSGVAKCSDGSVYQLPQMQCKPDASGTADCQGEYGQGQKFPMSMKSN